MLSIFLLLGVWGDATGASEAQLELEFTDDDYYFAAVEGPDESAVDRRLDTPNPQNIHNSDMHKNLALATLKKMHSAHKMFNAYKDEKKRLERRAFVSYAVGGVFLLIFSGGMAGYVYKVWKTGQLPTEDEEALMNEERTARAAEEAIRAKPTDEQRLMGPSVSPEDEDAPLNGGHLPRLA
jgi:hypothetical protein